MSRAGQGNEAGSVFRCVAATHLAVHGLRGASISGLELSEGLDLVRLDFETSDPTDDIRATFADGTHAYISAKRKVSTREPLEETVTGWIRQADTLRPGDLLVIAGEEFVGPAKDLDRVLRRHRAGLPQETEAEKKAFKALDDLLPAEVREIVLDRARVLHLPKATTEDLLAALMDLAVEGRHGRRAVGVLANLFHQQAGEALGSGIEDWVAALNDTGVVVIPDLEGPLGTRVACRMKALSAYLERLRDDEGQLDLSLLADDLPPIVIDDLIDNLQIDIDGSTTSDDLLRHLRRWRRMLIVGQPGSGKSVALREIAAHCATHPYAPIPIPVSLPRMLKTRPERWTLDGLVDLATADLVGETLRGALSERLLEALVEGHAILLCDGLDECGRRAPWAAQQLANILQALHPQAGFVLATRANAEVAAGRLGLRRVELAPPNDLSDTVERVLASCAEARVPELRRESWLAIRRTWIEDAKDQHADLLRVPLLAVLLTLICAAAPDADLPKGRATLLHRAVEESVDSWERRRGTLDPDRPWSPELTTAMLLQGFIVLGRILDGGANPSRAESLDALAAMLTDPDQWAMPPARAREIAAQVLRFWDEHVAVFVVDATEELRSRSKVFAEIATAMWASTRSEKELTSWLDDAISYTDSDGAIALAAGLDPRTIGTLLRIGAAGRAEATLMAADLVARRIVDPQAGEIEPILHQLTAEVAASTTGGAPAKRGPRNPPARFPDLLDKTRDAGPWPFVEVACLLALSPELRPQRTDLIIQAALDERAGTIAAALCALTDATTDGQPLGAIGASAVDAALSLPLPPHGELINESRRRLVFVGGGELAAGLPQLALAAAECLGDLADGAGQRILEIAGHTPHGSAEPIYAALARAGVDTSRSWARWLSGVRNWATGHKYQELTLLSDMGSLAEPDPSRTDGFWSLSELGDLLSASGYNGVSIRSFDAALTTDTEELRRAWLGAVADAHGLDRSVISNQALHVRKAANDSAKNTLGDDWFVASAAPIDKPSLRCDLDTALKSEQHRTLVSCLDAHSDWIAWSAAAIAINLGKPDWDSEQLFSKDMSHRPRDRAALVYLVAILSAGDKRSSLLRRAAASDSSDYRDAARMTISVTPRLDPDGSITAALQQDPDLAVRSKEARKLSPPPTHWSCGICRHVNALDVEDCPGCEDGTRPDS
jgi:hypothetical protein